MDFAAFTSQQVQLPGDTISPLALDFHTLPGDGFQFALGCDFGIGAPGGFETPVTLTWTEMVSLRDSGGTALLTYTVTLTAHVNLADAEMHIDTFVSSFTPGGTGTEPSPNSEASVLELMPVEFFHPSGQTFGHAYEEYGWFYQNVAFGDFPYSYNFRVYSPAFDITVPTGATVTLDSQSLAKTSTGGAVLPNAGLTRWRYGGRTGGQVAGGFDTLLFDPSSGAIFAGFIDAGQLQCARTLKRDTMAVAGAVVVDSASGPHGAFLLQGQPCYVYGNGGNTYLKRSADSGGSFGVATLLASGVTPLGNFHYDPDSGHLVGLVKDATTGATKRLLVHHNPADDSVSAEALAAVSGMPDSLTSAPVAGYGETLFTTAHSGTDITLYQSQDTLASVT